MRLAALGLRSAGTRAASIGAGARGVEHAASKHTAPMAKRRLAATAMATRELRPNGRLKLYMGKSIGVGMGVNKGMSHGIS